MLGNSISTNSLLLGLFAMITAGLLAVTQYTTKDKIAAAERKAETRALLEIVPLERHSNDLLADTLPVPAAHWEALNLKAGGDIHIARDTNGDLVASIFPVVAPDGYSGAVRLIVGVNRDGSIAGARVISHKETPGLGDKIELKKSDWILSFNGHSLESPPVEQWTVKKNGGYFDQFTGATVTPRAVTKAIKRTLQTFNEVKPQLTAPITTMASEPNKEAETQ